MLCVLATLDDCRISEIGRNVYARDRKKNVFNSDGENVTCDFIADNCVCVCVVRCVFTVEFVRFLFNDRRTH